MQLHQIFYQEFNARNSLLQELVIFAFLKQTSHYVFLYRHPLFRSRLHEYVLFFDSFLTPTYSHKQSSNLFNSHRMAILLYLLQ